MHTRDHAAGFTWGFVNKCARGRHQSAAHTLGAHTVRTQSERTVVANAPGTFRGLVHTGLPPLVAHPTLAAP